MCGPGVAIIKAEPGVCLGPPLPPDFAPHISSSSLCLPAEVCLASSMSSASPPTISIQESPGPGGHQMVACVQGSDCPGPLSYTVSLALPSLPTMTSPLALPLLPLHPLPPPGHIRSRSPLLSISEVTNTLLDHNQ